MNAFHVFSSAPFLYKNPGKEFFISKCEIYCMVLSALSWRKVNGDISLISDDESLALFTRLGITQIWNNIKISLCNSTEGIDPATFWAGAKLFALRDFPAPCVMIDTDFIVWSKLSFNDEIIAAHEEQLTDHVYPDISNFNLNGYTFPDNIDFSTKPLNTAFLYMPDEDFKQYYTSQSIAFMKCTNKTQDPLTYMVFAEQRLLPMLAKKCNIKYTTLLNDELLFYPQDKFTHLWGAKQVMRDDKRLENDFCQKCIKRIYNDFSDYSHIVDTIENYYLEH